MNIEGKTALVTGAASGIGLAVAKALIERGAAGLVLVDLADEVKAVAADLATSTCKTIAAVGDTTDEAFRRDTLKRAKEEVGLVRICVPCAGITRDRMVVKVDKESGEAQVYPLADFRLVLEVNLTAPVFWAAEVMAGIAEDRFARGMKRWTPDQEIEGTTVFIGSISSGGNVGQVSYSSTKAGLVAAASTLTKEGMFHGYRATVIHPGFTNTPMVQAMGQDLIDKVVIPHTQLKRLIEPAEIARTICFMIENPIVSGPIWADAGWHPLP
ncbi:SDR family NAD(P)-dependent oxidoreductase [Haloferula sp.]|uniref:SDR family NAD(P)-dependent oxidoreductase n=1 Tax=Haloferula sp. TaxID=2497595 RepID=UPI003C7852FD